MKSDGWSSRKVWVALSSFGIGTTLLVMGYIEPAQWQWFSSVTVASYLAANVVEKVRLNGKKK